MIANTGKFSRFGFQFKPLESYEKIAAAPYNKVLLSEVINLSLPQTFLPKRPVAAKRSRTAHTEPGQTTYDTMAAILITQHLAAIPMTQHIIVVHTMKRTMDHRPSEQACRQQVQW